MASGHAKEVFASSKTKSSEEAGDLAFRRRHVSATRSENAKAALSHWLRAIYSDEGFSSVRAAPKSAWNDYN
jgi:hypothetical protein